MNLPKFPRLVDYLTPKGDSVQLILKKKGKPVSGIFVDDKQEIRSPELAEKEQDEKPDRRAE